MKAVKYALLFMMLLLVPASAGTLSAEQEGFVNNNTTLYTQVGMWYEFNKRSNYNQTVSTNYSVGIYLPPNSEIVLTNDYNRKGIFFTYQGEKIMLQNIAKYSKVNVSELVARTFGANKVDLSAFSKAEREQIMSGKVEVGMSKDAVRIARGYPPAHMTPSLERDSWKYWENRWNTTLVNFKEGKVSEIIN